MFNSETNTQKLVEYREPLHSLLFEYPDGLSAFEIADQLKISDEECQELLKLEESREALEVNLESDSFLYKSKRKIKPNNDALDRRQQKVNKFNLKPAIIFLTIPILIGTIALTLINFFEKNNTPQDISISENWVGKIVNKKTASEEKNELEKQKEDYNQRIENMQKISRENDCTTKWNQKEKCYLEGRLLTKEEFEKEMAEMRLEVTKINEILTSYD